MMRQSAASTVELNTEWRDKFTAEPFEVAWASEAIYFIRALESEGVPGGANARVQISPDGLHWCDEGTLVPLPAAPGTTFARITHFGGWLRLVGELPNGAHMKVIVHLVLKS